MKVYFIFYIETIVSKTDYVGEDKFWDILQNLNKIFILRNHCTINNKS